MKLLWIEEETETVLSEFKTYLTNQGYLLDIIYDASEAEAILSKVFTYDLIILDIRINAGYNEKWINLQIDGHKKLGLFLLTEIIAVDKKLIGSTIVFTNESWENLEEIFLNLGIPKSKYMQKNDAYNAIVLERFILNNKNSKI